ncbi:MAG: hypothetical protein QM594_12900 [Niabella sp.]
MTIPAFAINLKSRPDRKAHIESEFEGQMGFATHVEEATEHTKGAIGLWKSIRKIVTKANNESLEYILLCEDDHCFTEHYNYKFLQQSVRDAQEKKADLLCGGVSWFKTGIQISKNLFWVEKFSGLQFTIIFRKFYQKILCVKDFSEYDAADYKLSDLTNKKFVIYPYMSTQKDFGYSDVTLRNNLRGRVEQLFADSSERFELLRNIKDYYSGIKTITSDLDESETENIIIPIYTIVERAISRFGKIPGKSSFEQTVIEAGGDNIQEKWKALCSCVQQAQKNSDDFIIITFDHIVLNSSFKKTKLLNNIIFANNYGSELLLGNIEMFNHAVPIANNLFWVDSFSYSSFIILFSPIFEKVISVPPSDNEDIYSYFSYLTSHKLVLYPFIADIKATGMKTPGFQERGEQLSIYRQVHQTYGMI